MGKRTLAELAKSVPANATGSSEQANGVHPNLIGQSKRQAIANIATVFGRGAMVAVMLMTETRECR